nr:ParA family protein [Streptomyces sp. SN-593]
MWLGIGSVKGGVGSTTAALELAYAATRRRVGRRHRRVAVIDLDPQAAATEAVEPASREVGVKDVFATRQQLSLRDVLVPTSWPRILIAPASRELANREVDLTPASMHVLREARDSEEIADLVDDVIIDIPRTGGRVAFSGLLATERFFVTAKATMWAFQGAEDMTYNALRVKGLGNDRLSVSGYIVSDYEESSASLRILNDMRARYGKLVCDPPIPRASLVPDALESYHTPCREFGDGDLSSVADRYQEIYDALLKRERETDGG